MRNMLLIQSEKYALIQTLYALRDDDAAEFEDGMRDYV